jgi:hypothetical protein
MGLLRRPTPGEIVEGERFGRPCGPGAHSRVVLETQLAAWMLLAMVAADMRHVRADSKKEISSLAMGSGSSNGAK